MQEKGKLIFFFFDWFRKVGRITKLSTCCTGKDCEVGQGFGERKINHPIKELVVLLRSLAGLKVNLSSGAALLAWWLTDNARSIPRLDHSNVHINRRFIIKPTMSAIFIITPVSPRRNCTLANAPIPPAAVTSPLPTQPELSASRLVVYEGITNLLLSTLVCYNLANIKQPKRWFRIRNHVLFYLKIS